MFTEAPAEVCSSDDGRLMFKFHTAVKRALSSAFSARVEVKLYLNQLFMYRAVNVYCGFK